MSVKNIFYAQSGGATAVINATAAGVIETARANSDKIGTVYAGRNGILGALKEELIDTSLESEADIAALRHTPSSAFGSCRYKLNDINKDDSQYRRLIEVFKAHNIGYFFYNGGNDSQDTAYKVSQISERLGYPLTCLGLPKTIDNDLAGTHCCPGFGSVAKYIGVSTKEAALDIKGMCETSTKIFILEAMGRHAGWIAAAAGLAAEKEGDAPHIILFPEIAFDKQKFLDRVKKTVEKEGYCVIVASEGTRNADGSFLQEGGLTDAFGHAQLGGVAPFLAEMIKQAHGYKYHWAVADYLQRAARHVASKTDVEQAYAIGKKAVECAIRGDNNIMLSIENKPADNQWWSIGTAKLADVANVEHTMPKDFISNDGFSITDKCRAYLTPLVEGESYPPYQAGMPHYVILKNRLITKRLESTFST